MNPIHQRFWILLAVLGVGLLAAWQCSSPPMPPLPATPGTPAIRVAILSPAEGELATFGRLLRNGLLMAFDEWNEQAKLPGYHIEWKNYSTDCTFDSGRRAARQALDDGLTLLIGPLCSEAAIAAAETAEAAGAVLIVPAGTHPLATVNPQGQTRPTVFRATPVDAVQGQAAAAFAAIWLKLNRAAVLVDPSDDYARRLVDAFTRQLVALDGQVVYRGSYSPGDADFSGHLAALVEAGAEVVYVPAPAAVVNRLAGQINDTLPPDQAPVLLGSDRWQSPDLDRAASAGSYFSVYFDQRLPAARTRTWAETYKAGFAIEPDTLAALGYDAATLLLAALRQSPSTDPAALAQTLERLTVDGVTGPIRFDAQHNPVRPIPFLQVNPQENRFVADVSPGPSLP